jgi:hypothetical protein
MIITESFVWINFPKTGSTFAREVFRSMYAVSSFDFGKRLQFRGRWMREELVPETRPNFGQRFGRPTPHGRVAQIPTGFHHLPVVSAIRDPVKRAYSLYTYGDWKKSDQLPATFEEICEAFPAFPDLSFEDYLDFIRRFRGRNKISVGGSTYTLGAQSVDFVSFFARSENQELRLPAFASWETLAQQLAEVRFLHVEDLNHQLFDYLANLGFPKRYLRFILSMRKINESSDGLMAGKISPELREDIERAEGLISLYRRRSVPPTAAELHEQARLISQAI